MAFTLWNLFEATILCLNAACILNDQRFLSKIDWNFDTGAFASSDQNRTVKHQLLKLIVSIKTVAKGEHNFPSDRPITIWS
ncbi:UNVERIFIED_CONTAM: hypothetical protein PYX00_008716 [Menopon gallinae]|uniref:Immediate early response 3-interacting protein 1 n=1 Tax=Menopon gallinae TaxID=328185 RepID=A0AAW2HNZ9_9NEOP